jgi:hypothetical protein
MIHQKKEELLRQPQNFMNPPSRFLDTSMRPKALITPQVVFRESADVKQMTPIAIGRPISLVAPLAKIPDFVFGKAQWAKFFGDVGVEPPLPADIDKILDSPCPIWGGFFNRKKVRDTHMLVLVPERVKGDPLTLEILRDLIKKPQQGTATQFRCLNLGQYVDPAAPKSHWTLMTKDMIPGSRYKSYNDQHAMITNLRKKTNLPYEAPIVLDTAVCILMEYFRTGGTRLYSDSPQIRIWTRTRTSYDNKTKLSIGGFTSHGLAIDGFFGEEAGIGCLIRFYQ